MLPSDPNPITPIRLFPCGIFRPTIACNCYSVLHVQHRSKFKF